eukprot:364644-Chlamydomonas_euryale.AAC.7
MAASSSRSNTGGGGGGGGGGAGPSRGPAANVLAPGSLDTASARLYMSEIDRAVAQRKASAALLASTLETVEQVAATVAELPTKTRRTVLVPFGRHAFFPGELRHTNELRVHLGCGIYAEMSAADAAAVLGRRSAELAVQVCAGHKAAGRAHGQSAHAVRLQACMDACMHACVRARM